MTFCDTLWIELIKVGVALMAALVGIAFYRRHVSRGKLEIEVHDHTLSGGQHQLVNIALRLGNPGNRPLKLERILLRVCVLDAKDDARSVDRSTDLACSTDHNVLAQPVPPKDLHELFRSERYSSGLGAVYLEPGEVRSIDKLLLLNMNVGSIWIEASAGHEDAIEYSTLECNRQFANKEPRRKWNNFVSGFKRKLGHGPFRWRETRVHVFDVDEGVEDKATHA